MRARHSHDELAALTTYQLRLQGGEADFRRCDKLEQVAVARRLEGKLAAQHGVHENTRGPNVGGWSLVRALLYDFGSHVGGRPTVN